MSVKRRAAQRLEGRGMSLGNIEHPVGTETVSSVPSLNQVEICLKLSQYSRAEEPPVAVSQYRVMLSRSLSRERILDKSPSLSVQDQNFSTIHAQRPDGESTRL